MTIVFMCQTLLRAALVHPTFGVHLLEGSVDEINRARLHEVLHDPLLLTLQPRPLGEAFLGLVVVEHGFGVPAPILQVHQRLDPPKNMEDLADSGVVGDACVRSEHHPPHPLAACDGNVFVDVRFGIFADFMSLVDAAIATEGRSAMMLPPIA